MLLPYKAAITAAILSTTLRLSYAALSANQTSPLSTPSSSSSFIFPREEERWSSLTGGPLRLGKDDQHSCQLLRDTCGASPQSNQASCTSSYEKCIADSMSGDTSQSNAFLSLPHVSPTRAAEPPPTDADASQWHSIWTADQVHFWIELEAFGRRCLSFRGTNNPLDFWYKVVLPEILEPRAVPDTITSAPRYRWVVQGGVNEFYNKLTKTATGNVSPDPKDVTAWDRYIFEAAMSLNPSLQATEAFTEMANSHAGIFSARCRGLADTIQRELDEEALESEISDPPDPAHQTTDAAKAKANGIPLLEIANLELYDQILDFSVPDGQPLKLLPGVNLAKVKDALWSLKNGAKLSTPVVARQFVESGFEIAPKASLVIHRSLYFDSRFPQIPQDPSELIGMLTAKAVVSYFAVLPSFYAGPVDILEGGTISQIIRLARDPIVLFRARIPFTATQLVDIGTKLGNPLMTAYGIPSREWSQNTVVQLASNLPKDPAVIEKFLRLVDNAEGNQSSGLEVFQSSLEAAKSHSIIERDVSADASSMATFTNNLSKTLWLSLLAGTHGTGAGLIGHFVPDRLRQRRSNVIKKYGADAVRQAVAAKNGHFLKMIGIVGDSSSSLSVLHTTTMTSITASSFPALSSTLSTSTTSSQAQASPTPISGDDLPPLESLTLDANINVSMASTDMAQTMATNVSSTTISVVSTESSITYIPVENTTLAESTAFAKETGFPIETASHAQFYSLPLNPNKTEVATSTSVATPIPVTSAESQSSSTSIVNLAIPQDTNTYAVPMIVIGVTSSWPSLNMTETSISLINAPTPTTMITSISSSIIDYNSKFNETTSNTTGSQDSASFQETGATRSSSSQHNITVWWTKEESSRVTWKWTFSWNKKPKSEKNSPPS